MLFSSPTSKPFQTFWIGNLNFKSKLSTGMCLNFNVGIWVCKVWPEILEEILSILSNGLQKEDLVKIDSSRKVGGIFHLLLSIFISFMFYLKNLRKLSSSTKKIILSLFFVQQSANNNKIFSLTIQQRILVQQDLFSFNFH